jgi:hypothetical protein
LDIGSNELQDEICTIGILKLFCKPVLLVEDGVFEQLDMGQIINNVEESCPVLLQLLCNIMAYNNNWENYRQTELFARLVAILGILCYSQQQNTFTGFQLLVGIYLYSKGIKKRQLEVLGCIGLVCSYYTILGIIKKRSEQAAADVATVGRDPTAVTAYNNFEQIEHVKEQQVDNQNSFHSVTTGQFIQGIEMPSSRLQQDMLDPGVSVHAIDIFRALGNQDDEIEHQVSPFYTHCMQRQ